MTWKTRKIKEIFFDNSQGMQGLRAGAGRRLPGGVRPGRPDLQLALGVAVEVLRLVQLEKGQEGPGVGGYRISS